MSPDDPDDLRHRAWQASAHTAVAVLLVLTSPLYLIIALVTAPKPDDEESWAEKNDRIFTTSLAFIGTALWLVALMTCAGGHR